MRRGIAAAVALLSGVVGCSMVQSTPAQRKMAEPEPASAPTPVVIKTVPPGTPLPAGAAPISTRPVKNPKAEAEKKAGKSIGPVITFAGAARADGQIMEPTGKNAKGYPVYNNFVGSGFIIVVEAKPGISNVEVGRSIFKYDANDPTQRPDLEIEVNRPLGDGNPEVCDARRPKIGGIPAVDPPSFAETKHISAALNDFACRFETFIESNASCTVERSGDFSFINAKESKVQFCMVVARSWNFPEGETLVSVRLRDIEGNPGPVSNFVVQRSRPPAQPARAVPTPAPTAPRRRP
jgi:hypothetical protein